MGTVGEARRGRASNSAGATPLWVGALVGLVALLVVAWTALMARPPLSLVPDPIVLGAFLIGVLAPGSTPGAMSLGMLHLSYLAGLGLLAAVVLHAAAHAGASGRQAFGAGLVAGGMNALAALPGATRGGGLTGVLLWLPAALPSMTVVGLVAGVAFVVLRRLIPIPFK